jgi:DNA modification methylase
MSLPEHDWRAISQSGGYGEAAASHNKSLSMHRWANWIAGFSGEFARSAIMRFLPGPHPNPLSLGEGTLVLDPFAGVGTTLVEANRLGLDCIGFEINPFAALVCRVKLGATDICLRELQDSVRGYKGFMESEDGREPDSSPPAGFRSRIPFFSPTVERKVLLTLDYMNDLPPRIKDIFRVAFASVMVEFSNYSYEPSLGTRPGAGKPLVGGADVGGVVGGKLRDMTTDIAEVQRDGALRQAQDQRRELTPGWRVYERSFFDAESCLEAASVDLVVTSPPYMNNYHYVRNSRPQLFWTGLVESSPELKRLETGNFGKFWQTVRGDGPIPLVPQLPQLKEEIAEIRGINSDRGIYGGNGWANYVTAYMNDLDRFCGLLARILKPGGTAVVVVGNSIVQGQEIKVEERLCEVAELRGLSVVSVTKLRERVGSSIINSGARLHSRSKSALYDAAVTILRPA